ncbi:MAG: phage protein Gp27 family protein [Pseudomonadota bacterium]|nr:phage protein Gp27 family protein [Pseudomonadota bacterium]
MVESLSVSARLKRHHRRPKPSSIDQLPDECEEDIVWANRELAGRSMPQTQILEEFNQRIAAKGCKPISKGSFSRHSVEQARLRQDVNVELKLLDVAIEMFPDLKHDLTALAREILKIRLVIAAANPNSSSKGLNAIGLNAKRALEMQLAEAEAERRKEQDKRDAAQREEDDQRKREAETMVEAVAEPAAERAAQIATEAGLSTERVAAIRRGVLGLTA